MNNLLAMVTQLCPHCGRPLKWRANHPSTVTYNAWCPGCVKLLYRGLPTTERPLLPTEALVLARSTPKLPEELEVEAIIQEWRGRWMKCPPEVVERMRQLTVMSRDADLSVYGMASRAVIRALQEHSDAMSQEAREMALGRAVTTVRMHLTEHTLTWVPQEVSPSSLREPEPDGKHRLHLCYDREGESAAVYLSKLGVYQLGYCGQGWPLGTRSLPDALGRAETLLDWVDFKPNNQSTP